MTDWLLAFGLTVAGRQRQVAVPLLATAAGVLIACQWPRLAYLERAVRAPQDPGVSRWSAAETALGHAWSPRVARLVLREPRLLWSVVLLLRGRRDGAPARTFSSYRDALPVWSVLAAVALLEMVVTSLLPLPRAAHVALLVLGGWGLLVIAGLAAALVVHPHLLTAQAVRLRFGCWDEVVVPRARVAGLRGTPVTAAHRGLRVADGHASLSPGGVTNMELDLRQPVAVRGEPVTRVRFWADAPAAVLEAWERPGPGNPSGVAGTDHPGP